MNQQTRKWARAATLGVGALLLGSVGFAGDNKDSSAPWSYGNYEKGTLTIALHRGNAVAFETFLPKLLQNCQGEMLLTLTWDEEENWVKMHLRGEHVLEPHPSIHRTEGVNFFPNEFWPGEPKDFEDGRYQFWTLAPAQMITFYYDASTLDIIGSEFEHPTPPPNSIPVPIPGIKFFPTPFFEPDAEGNVDLHWTFAYDHVVRGDAPEFAHMMNTYPPSNLCLANPSRYDLSTTRPYISEPLPSSAAQTFGDYLRNGLIFDLTIEPRDYPIWPPRVSATSAYSGMTVTGGAVPPGYALDLDAVFMNNAPPIRPFEYAGTCQDEFKAHHIKNINFCQPPAQ